MQFPEPLLPGRLLRRYKRFLADVVLENGTEVVAHCANPGSMLGLAEPGAPVWLSQSDNPKRKLRYSWELVAVQGQAPEQDDGRSGFLVGTHTGRAKLGTASCREEEC